MHWVVLLCISLAVLIGAVSLAIALCILPYKRERRLTPNKVLVAGVGVSSTVLLFPFYLESTFDTVGFIECVKALIPSAFHAIRLFAFDGGYADCFESEIVRSLSAPVGTLYSCFGALLYVFAPMLTLSVVISFIKDASAFYKYARAWKKNIHVFSELNEKSLILAKSIDENNNKASGKYKLIRKDLFVFCGVSREMDEKNDLYEGAKEIGAICFSKDMDVIRFAGKGKRQSSLAFYLMSGCEEKNIRHAESVIKNYDLPGCSVRVFSEDIRCELLLAAKHVKNIHVTRINETQSLVYHNLDLNGLRLFRNARDLGKGDKVISAVIVGLGKIGIETLKALSWFCQMDGYSLKIKAFDKDADARDKFSVMCPELMDESLNGKNIPGESRYEIDIVGGVNVGSNSFVDAFSEITDATYVFVCLGSDVENLDAAVNIRSLTERIEYIADGRKPDIETVIYDPDISASMGMKWKNAETQAQSLGVTNFKNEPYRIHMIGNLDELYSVNIMLDSQLIKEAEDANTRYAELVYENEVKECDGLAGEELSARMSEIEAKRDENLRAFYRFDYNYRSSLSRIIHRRKSEELGIKRAEQEHRRWNAYMRSEGYRFSGSKDKDSRNDLAKLHHDLVPFSELEENTAKKDQ